MDKQYPAYYEQLTGLMGALGKEISGPMAGFGELHKQSMIDGAFERKDQRNYRSGNCDHSPL